jgi:uncharacterized protein YhfF
MAIVGLSTKRRSFSESGSSSENNSYRRLQQPACQVGNIDIILNLYDKFYF